MIEETPRLPPGQVYDVQHRVRINAALTVGTTIGTVELDLLNDGTVRWRKMQTPGKKP